MTTLTIATFLLVALRAIQQQNFVHGHYTAAVVTSYLLAMADVAVVLQVVNTGWPAVPYVGTGGAMGVVAAMWLHRTVINRKKERKT